jgi:hypothetical protein
MYIVHSDSNCPLAEAWVTVRNQSRTDVTRPFVVHLRAETLYGWTDDEIAHVGPLPADSWVKVHIFFLLSNGEEVAVKVIVDSRDAVAEAREFNNGIWAGVECTP